MHKAGFVNIVGNPNVGKSTLMNLLVGERISIATFKSQTTRHRIMGILNTDDMQIVFSDTPGVVKPNYKLQESMLNFSESALVDADILLVLWQCVVQSREECLKVKTDEYERYMLLQEKYFSQIIEQDNRIRGYRHDMAAHLAVLGSFYENGEVDKFVPDS